MDHQSDYLDRPIRTLEQAAEDFARAGDSHHCRMALLELTYRQKVSGAYVIKLMSLAGVDLPGQSL